LDRVEGADSDMRRAGTTGKVSLGRNAMMIAVGRFPVTPLQVESFSGGSAEL
jgi:hypothetical protein